MFRRTSASKREETSNIHIWHILSLIFMFNVFDMVSTSISINSLDVSYIHGPTVPPLRSQGPTSIPNVCLRVSGPGRELYGCFPKIGGKPPKMDGL